MDSPAILTSTDIAKRYETMDSPAILTSTDIAKQYETMDKVQQS